MKAWLRTRGRVVDYQFLAAEPADAWWRTFSSVVVFERPALIVDGPHRLFLSGIPSSRTDGQRRIRCTLVMDLEGASELERQSALKLAQRWVADARDLDAPSSASQVGARLDELLPEERVKQLLREELAPQTQTPCSLEVLQLILTLMEGPWPSSTSPTDSAASSRSGGRWSGGATNPRSRTRFDGELGRLLINGGAGAAVLANVATLPNATEGSPLPPGELAILLLSTSSEPSPLPTHVDAAPSPDGEEPTGRAAVDRVVEFIDKRLSPSAQRKWRRDVKWLKRGWRSRKDRSRSKEGDG